MNHPALPRSLSPAPGEVLPGYLLRVAHRIGITPYDLARRCGLTTGASLPAYRIIRLDPGTTDRIATVCRLEPAEVHTLTLAGHAPAYPPLHPYYLGVPQTPTTMARHGWGLTGSSRYCPNCLAETADTGLGAIWLADWRLAITFLYPKHDRLLDERCPSCHTPAFSTGYRPDRHAPLIPTPSEPLQPAACRSRLRRASGSRRGDACGHPLTRHGTVTTPTAAMTSAQQRLAQAARLPQGSSADSRFLNDARAASIILSTTWPTAHVYFTNRPEAALLTGHTAATSPSHPPDDAARPRSQVLPPVEVQQTAALLTLTVGLLDDADGMAVLADLLPLVPKTGPARRCLGYLAAYASPRMTSLLHELASAPSGVLGRPPLNPQPATHTGLLDPGLIPRDLPDAVAAPLGLLVGPAAALRRDAPIRLVQMATGCSRPGAARHLQVGAGTYTATSHRMRCWLRQPGNFETYQIALGQVAAALIASATTT
ncbi:TniQ family protein [Streptomyces sp. ZAF1911]|uniref:TniQ family protein n=1 Tax=Streptomyces sp. ZAF1911 TaxID=2944129 RepID=UPI00237B1083|nr:TniQ family protein [Streptomyces sp. ZAF1911]MDD9380488.1 TniQ family protein [Streptomyces sp. ZAF1911]